MSAAIYRKRLTLRRNAREARVISGLVWLMVVAGVETVGDALAGAVRRS